VVIHQSGNFITQHGGSLAVTTVRDASGVNIDKSSNYVVNGELDSDLLAEMLGKNVVVSSDKADSKEKIANDHVNSFRTTSVQDPLQAQKFGTLRKDDVQLPRQDRQDCWFRRVRGSLERVSKRLEGGKSLPGVPLMNALHQAPSAPPSYLPPSPSSPYYKPSRAIERELEGITVNALRQSRMGCSQGQS